NTLCRTVTLLKRNYALHFLRYFSVLVAPVLARWALCSYLTERYICGLADRLLVAGIYAFDR
ncbi:MAG: hypothetical protein L7S59_07120, partial [Pseudomonadales bacterium]|nr:hypothetical protein [Pseudomonadales bacterium]